MPTRDVRLPLAILLLAGVEIGLPWADGGRSPVGHAGLVLLLVLAGAVGLFSREHGPLPRPSPWLLLAALLAGGSALHTIHLDRTIQSLLLLVAYILAGTLAARGARDVPWAEPVLLTAIFTSGVLVTGIGMLRLYLGRDGGVYAALLTGPFGYPNAMAGFLLLAVGAALAVAWEDRGPLLRGAAMGAATLAAVGVLLTRSRGALLAGAVGFAAWIAIQRRGWRPQRRVWLPLGAIALLTVLAVLLSPVGTVLPRRFLGGNGLADSSFLWRWQILRWTWAMVRDHPWWGVGPGAFPVALTQYQRLPYVSGENPHNLYLELAAEYGLPAGMLAVLGLCGFLGRMGAAIRHATRDDPVRGRLAALMAALVAFLAHNLVDMDWSFPAVALTGATLLGLASAHLRRERPPGRDTAPVWRGVLLLLLIGASVLSLTRFYATTLVGWARFALTANETASAQQHLTWALRLNPFSFPAHQWLARARLRSGDIQGAVEISERAARIAPSDPIGRYLAGEVAAAAGRWDTAQTWFRSAVDQAPAAQLRFHAGLVEASARGGREAEAPFWYEHATATFTPVRVLDTEARCLAPGDRYLLAWMSRITAALYAKAGDRSRQQALLDRAQLLSQPDPRGICAPQGRPGQTSPEATAESFWSALAEGGWPLAERFVVPELRRLRPESSGVSGTTERPPRARLAWVAALSGGERRVSLRSEVEIELPGGSTISRCTQMDLRVITDTWFVETLPLLEPGPCQP